MFRFEKLDAWQMAVALAERVYQATGNFPDNERFGLTSQMRRSTVSISSNIAEGTGRSSDADFARFLEIAYGSLMEVVSQSHIAKLQGFLNAVDFDDIYQSCERLARVLSGLRSSLSGRNPKRPSSGPRPSTLDPRR
jgi:four helix bundle protein